LWPKIKIILFVSPDIGMKLCIRTETFDFSVSPSRSLPFFLSALQIATVIFPWWEGIPEWGSDSLVNSHTTTKQGLMDLEEGWGGDSDDTYGGGLVAIVASPAY
jgi:hypothetical protein